MKQIKKIVIVGGGTAGWSAALNFLQKTVDVKIEIVAAKEIPIIGVGESTTGQFDGLINLKGKVNIDETDFLLKTGSTYKIGIKHTDWHTIGESFTSPLGDEYRNDTGYPSYTYDYFRIYHVAENLKYQAHQSQFMLNDRIPFLISKGQRIDLRYNHVAYHLDTYKVGQYLKNVVLSHPDCSYIDDIVVGTEKFEDGIIKSIITKTGRKIEGDLFVDCSGTFRVLIQKEFDNTFHSYNNELMMNRAMPFHIANSEDTVINNYTHVVAKKYGWMWDIPLQHRKGCGYVYNDNFITPDQAQAEIEQDLGIKIDPQRDIKFEAGRLEKFWIKNVISAGLSSAFVEPLEATSIHMTVLQINHFIEQYFTHTMDFNNTVMQDRYNKSMTSVWDDIKDFIVMHYITPRKDTEFWIEASSEKRRSEELKNKLAVWKTRMPRTTDYKGRLNDNFYDLGNTLWMQVLLGMKLLDPKIAKDELTQFGLNGIAKIHYDIRKMQTEKVLSIALSTNDFYKKELQNLDLFKQIPIDELPKYLDII
jgi:tryptophan halogenase